MARTWILTGSPERDAATAPLGYEVIGPRRRAVFGRDRARAGRVAGA